MDHTWAVFLEVAIFGLGNAGVAIWKLSAIEQAQKDHCYRLTRLEADHDDLIRDVATLKGRSA